jgi:hypothetical protein
MRPPALMRGPSRKAIEAAAVAEAEAEMGMRLDRDPDQPVLVAGSPDSSHRSRRAPSIESPMRPPALMRGPSRKPRCQAWGDYLVALATVADVVPLHGLNRAFVRQGLAVMRGRGRGAGGHPASNRRCVRRR